MMALDLIFFGMLLIPVMIGFMVGVIKSEGFTPSPYKPTKEHDIKKLRKQAEEFLQRSGYYNETGIVETGNNWAVARICTLNGHLLPDKLHLKINGNDDVLSIEVDESNSFYTKEMLADSLERENISPEILKANFSRVFRENITQLEAIENKISEDGEATIYSQSFNDNKKLSLKELRIFCDALKEENFIVLRSNEKTGEVTVTY